MILASRFGSADCCSVSSSSMSHSSSNSSSSLHFNSGFKYLEQQQSCIVNKTHNKLNDNDVDDHEDSSSNSNTMSTRKTIILCRSRRRPQKNRQELGLTSYHLRLIPWLGGASDIPPAASGDEPLALFLLTEACPYTVCIYVCIVYVVYAIWCVNSVWYMGSS